LYEKISLALKSAYLSLVNDDELRSCNSNNSQTKLHKAKAEDRLGAFFRWLHPETAHRMKSRKHFACALEICQKNGDENIAKKATFFLATFATDHNTTDASIIIESIEIVRCPENFVASLYSTFAEKFDELLVDKLNYPTPSLLRKLVDQTLTSKPGRKGSQCCVDLGCGTGLSGLAFRDCTEHMIGVDLSPEMIEKAKERKCYDTLVVGCIESTLESTLFHGTADSDPIRYVDLVVACDVFVYLGDLQQVFEIIRQCLAPGVGRFAFSIERLQETAVGGKGFVLQRTARFAHKRSYLEGLGKNWDSRWKQ